MFFPYCSHDSLTHDSLLSLWVLHRQPSSKYRGPGGNHGAFSAESSGSQTLYKLEGILSGYTNLGDSCWRGSSLEATKLMDPSSVLGSRPGASASELISRLLLEPMAVTPWKETAKDRGTIQNTVGCDLCGYTWAKKPVEPKWLPVLCL